MNIKYALTHPKVVLIFLLELTAWLWPDKLYLKMKFFLKVGMVLDLRNPKTYNQKLQWLKLYNRCSDYTVMVDKVKVKKYVASIIGNKYIIPTLGVWNSPDEIEFDKLPNQFVLKCNHDSGGYVICRDKATLNIEEAKVKLRKGIRTDYYKYSREWPYRNVERKILAEQYMEDETGELRDFKFFCFHGEVKALFVATDRFTIGEETKFDFFDKDFNHLPFTNGHPNSTKRIEKPKTFDEMKRLATELSKDIPHSRIDFYSINGNIYFGEITFYHWSGMIPFKPIEWDYHFGSWIRLIPKD